jgi:hypothetical protein
MIWVMVSARMGETRNAHKIFFVKPERKRQLGKPRRNWEDNIRTDLGETGWEGVYWIHLAQDRDQWRVPMNTAMNHGVT